MQLGQYPAQIDLGAESNLSNPASRFSTWCSDWSRTQKHWAVRSVAECCTENCLLVLVPYLPILSKTKRCGQLFNTEHRHAATVILLLDSHKEYISWLDLNVLSLWKWHLCHSTELHFGTLMFNNNFEFGQERRFEWPNFLKLPQPVTRDVWTGLSNTTKPDTVCCSIAVSRLSILLFLCYQVMDPWWWICWDLLDFLLGSVCLPWCNWQIKFLGKIWTDLWPTRKNVLDNWMCTLGFPASVFLYICLYIYLFSFWNLRNRQTAFHDLWDFLIEIKKHILIAWSSGVDLVGKSSFATASHCEADKETQTLATLGKTGSKLPELCLLESEKWGAAKWGGEQQNPKQTCLPQSSVQTFEKRWFAKIFRLSGVYSSLFNSAVVLCNLWWIQTRTCAEQPSRS